MHCACIFPYHSARIRRVIHPISDSAGRESDLGPPFLSVLPVARMARHASFSVGPLDRREEVLAAMRRCIRRGQRSRIPIFLVQDDGLGDGRRFDGLAQLVSFGCPDRLLHDDPLGDGTHRGVYFRSSVFCSGTTDHSREALERYASAQEGETRPVS